MWALNGVNRWLLFGIPVLRAIPFVRDLPLVHGHFWIRDVDLPACDRASLCAAVNPDTVAFMGPNHPEFGTDWLTGVFPGRLMLQVARDPSFTDLVVDTTYECPASFEPSCPSTATIGPLADGTYVWRILWLSQPDGAPSHAEASRA